MFYANATKLAGLNSWILIGHYFVSIRVRVSLHFAPVRFWFSDDFDITVRLPVPLSAKQFKLVREQTFTVYIVYIFQSAVFIVIVLRDYGYSC